MEILAKSQRNALWRALEVAGLCLGDFSYSPLPWEDEAKISHTPSRSIFLICRKGDRFSFTSQVGNDPAAPLTSTKDFENIVEWVGVWGSEASEWMETPDLWKSVPDAAIVPGDLTPESDNSQFTPDEQAAISTRMREIREAVKKTYELTAEQSAKLDEKFEDAEKASRRMGRKDWGMFFGGAVLSLILSDAITPAIMGDILMMVQHGIGHLFMGGPMSVQGILSAGQD
jgi:hypothetical protein